MTKGPIRKDIVSFALPLFFGNLFQQLYSTVDSLIVGNTLGQLALASVSSSGALTHMLVGFFNGVAMGAGVVISKYFGARHEEKMRRAMHTDLAFGLVSGVFMTIFGVLLTPAILVLMKTPEDILPGSILYFRIYSAGLLFTIMYNICMGIMNAVGDSRHPLYYLVISSILNVILDLFFIVVLGYGVASAALATIISQGVSVVLSFKRLLKKDEIYKIKLNEIKFDLPILKQIIRFGLPSGVQNSVINFANVVVQTNINSFSSATVAGSGSYAKIEGFVFLPITAFTMALTTFISQNLGARNYDRAKKGMSFGIACSMVIAEAIGLVVFILAPQLISLFNRSEEVIRYGVRQARIEALFYCFLALSHSIAAILRGAGKAKVPMCIFLGVWCLLRVSYITIALKFIPAVEIVYTAYPLTWSVSSVLFVIYLIKADWVHALDKSY